MTTSVVLAVRISVGTVSAADNAVEKSPVAGATTQALKPPALTTTVTEIGRLPSISWIDTPLTSVKKGDNDYEWYHFWNWGTVMQKSQGTLENPMAQLLIEKRNQSFIDMQGFGGGVWIQSLYKCTNGNLLGFCHLERVFAENGEYKGRVGLAYSQNNGDSWTYLGHIVSSYNDWFGFDESISGGPFIVKDQWLYVYFNESANMGPKNVKRQLPLSVARAKFDDVLANAKDGKVTPFKKYFNGDWTEDGLGGQSTPVFHPGSATNDVGIGWHMTYNTYLKQYMFVYCAGDTKLTFSKDGLAWSDPVTIRKTGDGKFAFYAGIVSHGPLPQETGRTFDVYTFDLKGDGGNYVGYRVQIVLGAAGDRAIPASGTNVGPGEQRPKGAE
jgi:hypothetical protein